MIKLLIFLLIPYTLWAGPFKITNRNLGTNPALEAQINTLFDQIEIEVNAQLPDADQSTYLKGMANASVMSTKGMGTSYTNEIIFTEFKYSTGIGVDLGAVGFSELVGGEVDFETARGIGIQQSFTLGVDLSAFGASGFLSDLELFFNYGTLDPRVYYASLKGRIENIGFHGRYRLGEKNEILSFGLLTYGGLFFHFGYEQNTADVKLTVRTNYSQTAAGLGTLSSSGTAVIGTKVQTYSIPLELSTYFDWLSFMTTHFGLGLDLNFGTAKSIVELNQSITYDSDITVGGDASLDLGQSGEPSSLLVRWFVGHQIHLSLLKINFNLGHVPGTGLWNVNAGIMLTY